MFGVLPRCLINICVNCGLGVLYTVETGVVSQRLINACVNCGLGVYSRDWRSVTAAH